MEVVGHALDYDRVACVVASGTAGCDWELVREDVYELAFACCACQST